ncbi:hypothetical protein MYX19_01930 [Nitrospinae bacterium AH-259-F20]|nr:hypothetical protein [Nitrospinae bacterium AH-259-F20]
MPLYLKVGSFITRHWHYKQLVREILEGRRSHEERVMALFDWTVRNIQPQPSGLPVVDDHVWHIIVRGYGTGDQVNDVLSTLATYAGFNSTWFYLQDPARKGKLYLTAINVDGRWHLFDPYYRNAFRHPEGRLASWEEIAADPTIAALAPNQPEIKGLPYRRYFVGLVGLRPDVGWSRGPIQQPWPRLKYEVRRWLGLLPPRKSGAVVLNPQAFSKAQ